MDLQPQYGADIRFEHSHAVLHHGATDLIQEHRVLPQLEVAEVNPSLWFTFWSGIFNLQTQ